MAFSAFKSVVSTTSNNLETNNKFCTFYSCEITNVWCTVIVSLSNLILNFICQLSELDFGPKIRSPAKTLKIEKLDMF